MIGIPRPATISQSPGGTLKEGNPLNLTCNVDSTSQPTNYLPAMTYRWQDRKQYDLVPLYNDTWYSNSTGRNYSLSDGGRVLTIGQLIWTDNHNIYFRCFGVEEGTTLRNGNFNGTDAGTDYLLDVGCKYC